MADLYEDDVVAWSEQQAALLRARAANHLDWDNIAEEIADVGQRQRDQIESHLAIASQHLLKWEFQPGERSNSWRASIVEARYRIAQLVRRIPSLAAYPAQVLADAYLCGRAIAEAETGLENLPKVCPWTVEQVLDPDFWPDRPDNP